jgi:predicted aspartyl protease
MSIVCGGPAKACELAQIAEMPVTMEGNEPLVDVTLDGRSVRFLVDTGSNLTLLTQAAAQQLGLKLIAAPGVTAYAVGGSTGVSTAKVRDFKLGTLVAHDFDMIATGRMRSDRFVGLLGRDVLLTRYDVELDLADHVIRLFKPKDCHGDEVVYWAKTYSLASIDSGAHGIDVEATLNGRRLWARLDSGAGRSFVTLDAARSAGVTPRSSGVVDAGMSVGMGGSVQTWTGTFQTLSVGDETVHNAELDLADLYRRDQEATTGSYIHTDVVETPGMLLGADFIKAHRIYIARGQGKLYFTYNGGRIFDLPKAEAGGGAASP